jgi:uncharacterized protein YijF (DUF1287 family)
VALSKRKMDAAQDAWEASAREWKLHKVNEYRPDGLPTWIVRHDVEFVATTNSQEFVSGDAIAAHKFHGPHGEEMARLCKREKIIEAVADALGVSNN